MGRLGPLTSQALGRSPYDDVVPGEGEDDPAGPQQEYDERGRPVCPETKRINKDVIRSHNEVMLVIGVAEPDNGLAEAQTESAARHHQHEERIGMACSHVGRVLEVIALWGVNGTRQRILLYKQYASVPFIELFRHERSQRPVSSSLLAGLPSFVLNRVLRQVTFSSTTVKKSTWIKSAIVYIRMHLEIFLFLQRMGIIPMTPWLPSLDFFIPCSSSSPIPPPPRLLSPTPRGVLLWLGEYALGVAPFASFFMYTRLWELVTRGIWFWVYGRVPKPHNSHSYRRYRVGESPQPTAVPSSTPANPQDGQPRNGRDISRDETTIRALEGQDQVSVGTMRRQSTFSARGDDYASDEEETEVVGATLISFDVEQTDSTDSPPGVWAAELRPNIADIRSAAAQAREGPIYWDNALTRLPGILAADIFALVTGRIIIAPVEALVLRSIARGYMGQQGMTIRGMYGINPFSELSFGAVANLLGLEAVHFFAQVDIWATMTLILRSLRMTEEEWNEFDDGDSASDITE